IKGLNNGLKEARVNIKLNSKVTNIIMDKSKIVAVEINNSKKVYGDYFIFATGGASYPLTGSTGECFSMLENLGHTIVELKPSLVPIEIKEDFIKELAGLSLRNIGLTIKLKEKVVYKDQGEIKFTYYGITGPLTLSGSRYIKNNERFKVIIDFKPALDQKDLDIRIQRDFKKYINNDFKNSLNDLLPQKVIPVIIELSGIDKNKKVNEITREERKKLVNLLKNFEITVKGLRPISEAIVTAGGVSTDEIDPSTMKSKVIENLSFAGEVIDVDAFTGGYNVQIALSTGYIAGTNI
ncbi:aminoacetone oxidase family FAD-binding enzyme, partial [Clostridium saudiense]|nr:aminoacetone oxidase family FAD-binding enzyme [Clostridium saudiense]